MKFEIEKIILDLKQSWNIARNKSFFKTNFILSAKHEGYTFKSEIAPNIRYGEDEKKVLEDFDLINAGKAPKLHSVLNAWSNIHFKINLYKTEKKIKPASKIKTSISIPLMPIELVEAYIAKHLEFDIFKVKINGNTSEEFLLKVLSCAKKKTFRIDANESFDNLQDYKKFEKSLHQYKIEFIEQPFKAEDIELYKELKKDSKYLIFADESIENDFDGNLIKSQFDGINIKLMKAGGIENAFSLIKKAKEYDLKLMLGCMIESSLGISEALFIADSFDYHDLDGSLLLKNDPYKNLIKINKDLIGLSDYDHRLHEHVHGPILLQ